MEGEERIHNHPEATDNLALLVATASMKARLDFTIFRLGIGEEDWSNERVWSTR